MHRDETFDVAIVGGGPGASVAALTLRSHVARAELLVDRQEGNVAQDLKTQVVHQATEFSEAADALVAKVGGESGE